MCYICDECVYLHLESIQDNIAKMCFLLYLSLIMCFSVLLCVIVIESIHS